MYEIDATGKTIAHIPVFIIQFLAFNASGFTQIILLANSVIMKMNRVKRRFIWILTLTLLHLLYSLVL